MIDETGQVGADALAWLQQKWHAAAVELGVTGVLAVRLVGDAKMCELHQRHCQDETTTDVLTFDLRQPVPGAGDPLRLVIETDVIVCVDEAQRQAAARGYGVEREILLYGVHGMLHCCGFDDHSDDDFAAMHAREDEVLVAIGVGPTFAGPAQPTQDNSR